MKKERQEETTKEKLIDIFSFWKLLKCTENTCMEDVTEEESIQEAFRETFERFFEEERRKKATKGDSLKRVPECENLRALNRQTKQANDVESTKSAKKKCVIS